MIVLASVLVLLLVGVVVVVLARTVRADGLGHRPPPATRAHAEGVRTW